MVAEKSPYITHRNNAYMIHIITHINIYTNSQTHIQYHHINNKHPYNIKALPPAYISFLSIHILPHHMEISTTIHIHTLSLIHI